MEEKTRVIQWILSRPEGQKFLAACLFTIFTLSAVVTWQEYRYEQKVTQVDNCERDKQQIIVNANALLFKTLTLNNERVDKMKQTLDSLYVAAKLVQLTERGK